MAKRWLAMAGVVAWTMLSAAPAQTQNPPAESMAAARELFVVMNMDAQFKAMLPMIMQALKPAIVQGRPQVERDYDAVIPNVIASTNAQMNEIFEGVAAIYARNFTAAEIREVTAFYRGPTGQKFLQKMPAIMQESMVLGQTIAARASEGLKERMLEELRKKGHRI